MSLRITALLLAFALVSFPFVAVVSADGDGSRRPLDLPSGGLAEDEEEEDRPETILFYGDEFEGDCFVWAIPAYGFCGETTVFTAIREEVGSTLNQLSPMVDFSLVAFNSTTYVWSPTCVRANSANKTAAQAWLSTLAPIEAHCLMDASVTALGILQAAPASFKQMIVCGAREPYCGGNGGGPYADGVLEVVSAANIENVPIHTVYFTSSAYSGEGQFYMDLAAMNGGTFRQVNY